MQVMLGRIGRVMTKMMGSPCKLCGSIIYQVRLQVSGGLQTKALVGRCIRCHGRRDLGKNRATATVLSHFARQALRSPLLP